MKNHKSRRQFLKSLGATAGLLGMGAHFPYEMPAQKQEKSEQRKPAIEAIVLGSAQDGGMPHSGCYKSHCEAARKDVNLSRRSPCLALLHHDEKQIFLFDAGPDLPSQLADLPRDWNQGRNPVAGVFLTHAHIGHYAGLLHFGREVMATSNLPVYCSEQMADFLRKNAPWSLLVDLKNIDLVPIEPGQKIELAGGLHVEVLAVPHRAEFTDTLAFIASGSEKSLLYLPDIDRWEQLHTPIENLVRRVDFSLLDGTFYSSEELPGRDMSEIPHPTVADSVQRLASVVAKGNRKIVFIHLNHSNLLLDADGERLQLLRSKGFDIAYDGMSFHL